jgi:hypothetical protein
MKNNTIILFLFLSSLNLFSQIPVDSLYLGQTPPGNTPKIFQLPVNTGYFAAERIAIAPGDSEIYYTEIINYSTPSTFKIKYFKYSSNKWNGPFELFNGYLGPAFSNNGDTLYFQDGHPYTWYSVRNDKGWSTPYRFWSSSHQQHYLQPINTGKYYLTSNPVISLNGDISELLIQNFDTTAQSLGIPLNSTSNGLDFFIAKDESYIIRVILNNGIGVLYISYHKADGSWTNPKNLGTQVNSSLAWQYGPYVTTDNKYIFYTRQYSSSTNIYCVRVDNLIDSLKSTNFIPYLKSKILNQSDTVGNFYSYTIPDSTFIDDDGNNTITYSATLSNGGALPSWLNFNPSTRTFSGTPSETGSFSLKIIATDIAKASISTTFTLKIINSATSIMRTFEQNIQVYPNPTKDKINISFGSISYKNAIIDITDIDGKLILSNKFCNVSTATIDLTSNPKGIYLISLTIDGGMLSKKICLE